MCSVFTIYLLDFHPLGTCFSPFTGYFYFTVLQERQKKYVYVPVEMLKKCVERRTSKSQVEKILNKVKKMYVYVLSEVFF